MNYKAENIYEVNVREARRKDTKARTCYKRISKLTYKILISGFTEVTVISLRNHRHGV
jgi:hypothetical protein